MNTLSYPVLSWTAFMPVLGSVAILLFARENDNLARYLALATAAATFVLSLPLVMQFDTTTHNMQFVESKPWIPGWNVNYTMGVDGISVLLVLLTTLLTLICVVSSWKAIQKHVKEYMIALLLLETGMVGVFCALDLFLFYIFWEAMLIPMYLLIGIWGGPNKLYAAVKFFLYTLAGSALMLIGIIALYYQGGHTFEIVKLMGQEYPAQFQFWLFLAFFLAFAIKVPMFPFHTWLPDAHVEAPTAGSVILAGVLLKMGTYGFLRFNLPMFPDATLYFTPMIMVISVVGIIYGALVAMIQADLKKLIAYSSVSHMGFVTLGIFALNTQGLEGGILQMLNHGVTTGALFLCVGIIYERTHTRMIADFGGLTKKLPIYATFFMIFTLSSLGLPGMNGFVGEFLILLGAFTSQRIYAVIGTTGIILGAAYMLWMFQRVMFMELKPRNESLLDMDWREAATLIPLAVLVFWIGLFPNPFLNILHVTVRHLLEQVNGTAQITAAAMLVK
ncbi:MAG: NADH-quinone oxidoreductase subunit M [Nitrospirae bacterium]|nr:NADH-quinone oxidoreductase subunit M [Nitrospirota bacterium]